MQKVNPEDTGFTKFFPAQLRTAEQEKVLKESGEMIYSSSPRSTPEEDADYMEAV